MVLNCYACHGEATKTQADRIDSSTKTEWNIVKTKHTCRRWLDCRPQNSLHIRHMHSHTTPCHQWLGSTNGGGSEVCVCVCVCICQTDSCICSEFTLPEERWDRADYCVAVRRLLLRRHSEEAKTNELCVSTTTQKWNNNIQCSYI